MHERPYFAEADFALKMLMEVHCGEVRCNQAAAGWCFLKAFCVGWRGQKICGRKSALPTPLYPALAQAKTPLLSYCSLSFTCLAEEPIILPA